MNTETIKLHVNGDLHEVNKDHSDMLLIEYLHEVLELTGTKFCCGIGQCKACTVLTKNAPTASSQKQLACATPVNFLKDMHIYTVESLGTESNLNSLQQAFLKHFSFQCGYCTPGFLMTATALLERLEQTPCPIEQLDTLILDSIGDNICRCTGYVRYVEAIREVALELLVGSTHD